MVPVPIGLSNRSSGKEGLLLERIGRLESIIH